ncbi:MAG TPA: hypothetical protein VMR23_17415 [Candidatus Limnocylindria bacterium]|nr:hypothetical protein [Candidatus Limnocylindria bacterium]
MTRWLLTLGVLAALTGVASAAPGDPRTVQGILEWPGTLENSRFIVVRTDVGAAIYVNVADARRAPGDVTAGSRLSALGVEGFQPHEVVASMVGPGDSALAGDGFPGPTGVSASPRTDTDITAAAPAPPPETLWQLRGTVQTVSGSVIVLRTRDGATHTVDATNLSQVTRSGLRPGAEISLYGVPQPDRRLVATGFVQSEPISPAASPATGRNTR